MTMAPLRIARPANACPSSVMKAFNAPSLQAQTPFTSTIIKATRTITSQASRAQSSPLPSTIRTHELRRAYASASPTQPIQSQNAARAVNPSDLLSWDRFLDLRRRRRYFNTGVSAVCAVAATIFGSPLIGSLDLDTTISQAAGVDPLIVIAAGSFAVGGLGWFGGRVLGGILFSGWARQRGWSRVFAEKEKSLFDRIKRYRADPSSSSPQNPIPDYYGEKIKSVKGYRRWLKDQRAFTKKMYRGVR